MEIDDVIIHAITSPFERGCTDSREKREIFQIPRARLIGDLAVQPAGKPAKPLYKTRTRSSVA
jgi:hypothetical protein